MCCREWRRRGQAVLAPRLRSDGPWLCGRMLRAAHMSGLRGWPIPTPVCDDHDAGGEGSPQAVSGRSHGTRQDQPGRGQVRV